jgi:cytochrome P450
VAFYNPFRPSYIENPYPALAQLRASEPVFRSPDLNAWVVTAYAECLQALQDDQSFSSDPVHASGGLGASVAKNRAETPMGAVPILGNSDPPDHTRLRAIVNRAFTPRAVASMRPHIEELTGTLLDAAEPDRPFEVMSSFAEPLPVITALRMLGFPDEDHEAVHSWGSAIIRARSDGADDPRVVAAAAVAHDDFSAYLERFASEKAPSAPDTVIATLLAAGASEGRISLDEVMMLLIHISMAGNGPTAYLLGNTLHLLLEHPEVTALLRERPDLIPNAVEEFLRFESPTHIVPRFALAESRLGKKRIATGDTVYVVIGAANRDPAQFPDPDRLDLQRKELRHLSFGMGIHFCLGARLARLEAAVALESVLRRFPGLHLAGGGLPGDLSPSWPETSGHPRRGRIVTPLQACFHSEKPAPPGVQQILTNDARFSEVPAPLGS